MKGNRQKRAERRRRYTAAVLLGVLLAGNAADARALAGEGTFGVSLQADGEATEAGQEVWLYAQAAGTDAAVHYRFTATKTESGKQYVLRDSKQDKTVWRSSDKEETRIEVEAIKADGSRAYASVLLFEKEVAVYPPYDWDTVYNTGDRVSYDGKIYEAQWWTQGGYPGNNAAWKEIGPDTGSPSVTPTAVPTVMPTATPTVMPTATPTAPPTQEIPYPPQLEANYNLKWHDEFDGTALNRNNWTYDIGGGNALWGNNELEYYTDSTDNVSVADGILTITARQQQKNGFNYTSGRIVTRGRQEFNQGYFEARIKMTNEQGFLPAFWMLGSQGGWPNAGEIDIMEHPNNHPACYGAVHWSDVNGQVVSRGSQVWNMPGYNAADWHTYGIKWTEEGLVWYLDNEEYFRYEFKAVGEMDEFTRPFYLLLNLAVGGNWPGSPDASTVWPNTMCVDYVRVFQK